MTKKKIYPTLILLALSLLWLGYAGPGKMGRSGTLSADVTVGNASHSFGWSAGQRGIIEASGTFGSGTITLYRWIGSGDSDSGNGEWVAFSGAALSTDGGSEFVTSSSEVSVGLSGSTSPDIDYIILPVQF